MNKIIALVFVALGGLLGAALHADPSATLAVTITAAVTGSLPCDIYAAAGNPCIAAHSTIRSLLSSYTGPLVQMIHPTDLSTQDIPQAAGGWLDMTAFNSFCSTPTTCKYRKIYNVMGNPILDLISYNDLNSAYVNGNCWSANVLYITFPLGSSWPIASCGSFDGGTRRGLANNGAMATGASPIGIYEVLDGPLAGTSGQLCCYDYGNVETAYVNNGYGHMFAIAGHGPSGVSRPMIDHENGVWAGSGPLASPLASIFAKSDGTTNAYLKQGDPTTGGLTLVATGNLPASGGPLALEGGITLAEPGDFSEHPTTGAFAEGAIVSGMPTDATENAVQANIVAAYSAK